MGFKIINDKNSLRINEKNFKYGELLLNFIYKDYSPVLSYIKQKLIDLHLVDETSSHLSGLLNCGKAEKALELQDELQLILSENKHNSNHKSIQHSDMSQLLNSNTHSNCACTFESLSDFFNEIIYNNPYLNEDNYKADPFFILFMYEFFKLYSNLSYENVQGTLSDIKKLLFKLPNLQDLYYEAINICFNQSHKTLNRFSFTARLEYYANLPYGINTIQHLSNNTQFSEHIILGDEAGLNKNLFNIEENYLDTNFEIYPPSTDVDSRLDNVYYKVSSKSLIHSKHKNYNAPSNKILKNLYENKYEPQEIINVFDFNNLLALCSFEFFNMIAHESDFSIQECKLCGKMFMKNPKSKKEYCQNLIFSDSNSFNNKSCCEKNVGNKIISELNAKSNQMEKCYNIIYKRLDRRGSQKDRNAFKDLKYFYRLFYNGSIPNDEFQLILKEFDALKTNTYKRENLPENIKAILDKM